MGNDAPEDRCELVVFQCAELYIYKVPPASTIGHRAELWDVDHWLQEVSLKVVTQGEECTIKLFDVESGSLFAECPVPKPEAAPLTTAVEAVVDSSRYFVLRLEDRSTKRHAFLGIGFRERGQASDFNAALSEHIQYLRRAREAAQLRAAYASERQEADGKPTASTASSHTLAPGETMMLRLGKIGSSTSSNSTAEASAARASMDGCEPGRALKLPPPPVNTVVKPGVPSSSQEKHSGDSIEVFKMAIGGRSAGLGTREAADQLPVPPDFAGKHTAQDEGEDWSDFVS